MHQSASCIVAVHTMNKSKGSRASNSSVSVDVHVFPVSRSMWTDDTLLLAFYKEGNAYDKLTQFICY